MNKNILYSIGLVIVFTGLCIFLIKNKSKEAPLEQNKTLIQTTNTAQIEPLNKKESNIKDTYLSNKFSDPLKSNEINKESDKTASNINHDTQPPIPPPGFTVQKLVEINGSVFVPQGWYFLSEKSGSTQAYFVTKEKIINQATLFETGLSMNVIPSSGVPGGDAYKYAKDLVESLKEKGSIEFSKEDKLGDASIFYILGTFQDGDYKFKMAEEIIANTKTNSLYLVSFESPINKWDVEWKNGATMLDEMVLDNSF